MRPHALVPMTILAGLLLAPAPARAADCNLARSACWNRVAVLRLVDTLEPWNCEVDYVFCLRRAILEY